MSQNIQNTKVIQPKVDGHLADRVVLRSYPKTIFFYPLCFVSFILALIEWVAPDPTGKYESLMAIIWLVMFTFNFLIITFQFSFGKTAGIVIVFTLLAVIAILLWPENTPVNVGVQFPKLAVSSAFYLYVGLIIFVILLSSILIGRLSFWEIRPTEIYIHGGLFEDSKRLGNAQGAHIEKETPDIFERILFKAGTIVITPEGSKTSYRLENVYNASKKEKMIREVLSYVPDQRQSA